MLNAHARRGQALVESIIFIPFMLLALFAIMYLSQASVLGERVQFAVRYGSQVAYPKNEYSIESMYNWYSTQINGVTIPITDTACAPTSTTTTAMIQAVYQGEEPAAAPTAYPTSPAYFQPGSTPVASCNPGVGSFVNNGNPAIALEFGSVTANSVWATINVPKYLQGIVGTSFTTQASMGNLNAAGPQTILPCRPMIAGPLAFLLSGNPSTGYNGYVAPNGNPHAC